jgi:hypothetical protein
MSHMGPQTISVIPPRPQSMFIRSGLDTINP